ncbi:25968_t:CDS:2, partial [Racocetra persica]
NINSGYILSLSLCLDSIEVLVYAVDNKDVQKAVKCAVEMKIDIVPRSGGHSYENYGLGGRNNTIGFGYYSRKYGLACDNIISMEMVDANGNLLQVDSTLNSDLFFALRGAGGGSYGIVTYFVFRIYRTPPQVTSIKLEYNSANITNMNQIYRLFHAFNKVGPSLDDGIALKMKLDKGSSSITGLYLGPPTEALNAMNKFLSEAPDPSLLEFVPQTFFEAVETLSKSPNKYEVVNPVHHPNFFKAKSFIVNMGKGLTKPAIDSLVFFLNNATCETFASFDLYGGAVNNYDGSSSFIHRDVLYCIQMESDWIDNEQTTGCVDEINNFGKSFQRNFTSYESYQDFIDRGLDDWQIRYYGGIFRRLVRIKSRYDPKNLFNFPQSIPVQL